MKTSSGTTAIKRIVFLAVLLSVLCAILTGCSGSSGSSSNISKVKNGTLEAYPDKKIGAAFNEFFASPKWEAFESTDGQEVVEFTGKFYYCEEETTAKIQFVIEGSSFSVYTIEFDDVPQNKLTQATLMAKVFEEE